MSKVTSMFDAILQNVNDGCKCNHELFYFRQNFIKIFMWLTNRITS